MPWRTMDVQDQRIRFVVSALQQVKPFTALCAEYGISRPTGYMWLERYRGGGVGAIAERSRRPHHSPEKTAFALEQCVVELRRCYPDWGARKLAVLLGRQGVKLPATQRTMADGLQGAQELAARDDPAIGHRRSQPLPDRAQRYGQARRRAGKSTA